MPNRSAGRPPGVAAGTLSRLTAEAITVYRQRAGLTSTALYEGAGMSAATYFARMRGRTSFTLNDIETFALLLGVTPDEISRLATKLGETASTPGRQR